MVHALIVLLKMDRDSTSKSLSITAASVECSEAIDWEIVRVTFDTEPPEFDEENRTEPYISLSANFEFGCDVQAEFHDGSDYQGAMLRQVKLWRDRAFISTTSGHQFHVRFDIGNEAFRELNEYLRVLLRSDPLSQENLAEQVGAGKPDPASS